MDENENLKRLKESEKQLRLVMADVDDERLRSLCHEAREDIQDATMYIGDDETPEFRVFQVLDEDAEETDFRCPHCNSEEVYEKGDWRACNHCLKWWMI